MVYIDICLCIQTVSLVFALKKKQQKNDLFCFGFPYVVDSGLLALCGPNRVLQESTCECVCRNGLTKDSCDPGWKLDHNTCKQAITHILTYSSNVKLPLKIVSAPVGDI